MVITASLLWADWRIYLQPETLTSIVQILRGSFLAHNETPHDQVLQMNAQDLMLWGFTPDEVLMATRSWRARPVPEHMRRRAPLSGDLHQILRPERKLEDRADEGTQLVMGTLSRCGHSNAAQAQAILGETIWSVVTRSGGWHQLCASTHEGCTTTRAQLKKSLVAAYRAEDEAVRQVALTQAETRAHLAVAKTRLTGKEAAFTSLSGLLTDIVPPRPVPLG